MRAILLILTILVASAGNTANAGVCITEVYGKGLMLEGHSNLQGDAGDIYLASLTCQELEDINNGVQVVAIGFSGAGIYAACTGVGLPATVALETGALALSAIGLIITNLDCDDNESEKMIKEKVDQAVCASLEAQGLECVPPLNQNNNDIFSI